MKTKFFVALVISCALIANTSQTTHAAGLVDWVSGNNNIKSSFTFALSYLNTANNAATSSDTKSNQSDDQTDTIKPVAKTTKTVATYTVSATGYSSEVGQTDDSPFITANGSYVRDGVIASNFLPFGTKVIFPDLFPNKIFEITDRMNSRYNPEISGRYNIDIWFQHTDDAIHFGRRTTKMLVLNN